MCGSDFSINVPIDLDNSYWNPSGDQEPPAVPPPQSPFDALGPAVVLVPGGTAVHGNAMPADVKCRLVFSDDVTNKANINVCAAAERRHPPRCRTCTPGDTTAFTFRIESLNISLSNPTTGGTLSRTDSIILSASDNIPLDPATLKNITLTPNAADDDHARQHRARTSRSSRPIRAASRRRTRSSR